ncbi:MAG: SAM-dependent methyltransferase [Rhodospirillales bacterium]|nr:MAG: SAM-dependent methyltransferase [Rhodospirillales bacterium]
MADASDAAGRRLPRVAGAATRAGHRLSALADLLRDRVISAGPLSIADFMGEALGHPEYGYYSTRDPFGVAGDFVTAPEISQMFGELVGLWCAQVWRTTLAPRPAALVELGPGRGTLMADALRAARMLPEFLGSLAIHLVETSPPLRTRQRHVLADYPVQWHRSLQSVPGGPAFLIANEFFDALPVRQFELTEAGWCERLVGLDPDGAGFRVVLAQEAEPRPPIPPETIALARVGDVAEVCPAALTLAEQIGHRIVRHGGAALIIDYGHAMSAPGETLQAVRGHARHDPLEAPGEADLTAHVDFATLSAAAAVAGAAVYGPVPQGLFLSRLGIAERAHRLRRGATPAQALEIDAACHRLIAAEEMGTLFKALAITPPGSPAPPGFIEQQ